MNAPEVTISDLILYFGKRSTLAPEVAAYIASQIEIEGSEIRRWYDEAAKKAAAAPDDIGWGEILREELESELEVANDSTAELPQYGTEFKWNLTGEVGLTFYGSDENDKIYVAGEDKLYTSEGEDKLTGQPLESTNQVEHESDPSNSCSNTDHVPRNILHNPAIGWVVAASALVMVASFWVVTSLLETEHIVDLSDTYVVGSFGIDAPDNVKNLLVSKQMPTAVVDELESVAGGFLGRERPGLMVLEPDMTATRPGAVSLQWPSFGPYDSYKVVLIDLSDGGKQTIVSDILRRFLIVDNLEDGHIYQWRVFGYRDGKEFVPKGYEFDLPIFKVLDRERTDAVDITVSTTNSLLEQAKIYAKAGLLDDAERALLTLEKKNPESNTIHQLLSSLRKRRTQ